MFEIADGAAGVDGLGGTWAAETAEVQKTGGNER